MDCIHRNGDILGYLIEYGMVESANTQLQAVIVSGGSVTETTISNLMSLTTYSIQVAAVNSAGLGVSSDHVILQTESKYNLSHILYILWSPVFYIMHVTYLAKYKCRTWCIPQSQ